MKGPFDWLTITQLGETTFKCQMKVMWLIKKENDHTSYHPKGNVNVTVHLVLWCCCKLFILACSKKPGTEGFYAKTLQWNGKRRTVALGLIQCSFY